MDSPRAVGPATVTAEARFASGDNDIQLSGTVGGQVVLCAATVADDMTFQIVPTSPTNLPHNPRSSSRSSASAALRHGSSITGVLADLHAAPALATAGRPLLRIRLLDIVRYILGFACSHRPWLSLPLPFAIHYPVMALVFLSPL